ncbi:MAG: DNA polymerase III subunit delta' C-terminal domain-containing protein, partial [Phascolarctobacterium sp.]
MSRVVCLRFQPVPVEQVAELLNQRGLEPTKAQVLARISEGSVGAALNLAEQNVMELRQQAVAFVEALPLNMPLNYLAGRAWQQKGFERPEALLFVKMLQLLLRDLIMCKLHLQDKLYNCDMQVELDKLAASWQLGSLKLALTSIQEAYAALENSVGVRLVLEAMALKIDQVYKE